MLVAPSSDCLRLRPYAPPPKDGNLDLIYQDAALLVLNKPAGLLSVPGRGQDLQDCALHRVRAQFPQALVVHRLDEATSGLLMFALSASAQKALSHAFETRRVKKIYLARVHGIVESENGCIDAPIAKDWPRRPLHCVNQEHGKPALTHYQTLSKEAHCAQSLLRLEPQTGRTHQLRVHLQSIGHPIVGDLLYGLPSDTSPRLMLHATGLTLMHPLQASEWMRLRSESPF
jgi:tRNA pseudouridine32 synthase / 23S rRNA pseudouridine746 synthase